MTLPKLIVRFVSGVVFLNFTSDESIVNAPLVLNVRFKKVIRNLYSALTIDSSTPTMR
jgi:hypothetical protein